MLILSGRRLYLELCGNMWDPVFILEKAVPQEGITVSKTLRMRLQPILPTIVLLVDGQAINLKVIGNAILQEKHFLILVLLIT